MNPAELTVTISKALYDQLVAKERLMYALEAAGVDNWDGWEFAHESLEENEQ